MKTESLSLFLQDLQLQARETKTALLGRYWLQDLTINWVFDPRIPKLKVSSSAAATPRGQRAKKGENKTAGKDQWKGKRYF